MADYDSKGQLVGIEILAPIQVSEIAKLVKRPQKTPFVKFLRQTAPQDFVQV